MTTIETSGLRPSTYEAHRLARHYRNDALHAFACNLMRRSANGLQIFARTSARLAVRLTNEWYQRRAIRALHRLDNRMLADIGLTRGDIEFVVRNGPPWHQSQNRQSKSSVGAGTSAPPQRIAA